MTGLLYFQDFLLCLRLVFSAKGGSFGLTNRLNLPAGEDAYAFIRNTNGKTEKSPLPLRVCHNHVDFVTVHMEESRWN